MVKEYIRKCDCCNIEIKNLYQYGVTTLYKRIRIGRGHHFKDYDEKSICNLMKQETPEDFDSYGKGWKNDGDEEFSFCSPNCLYNFFGKLYNDTYKESLQDLSEYKDYYTIIQDLEKRKKMNPIKKFFDRSKNSLWLEHTLKSLKEQKIKLNNKIKEIETLYKEVVK